MHTSFGCWTRDNLFSIPPIQLYVSDIKNKPLTLKPSSQALNMLKVTSEIQIRYEQLSWQQKSTSEHLKLYFRQFVSAKTFSLQKEKKKRFTEMFKVTALRLNIAKSVKFENATLLRAGKVVEYIERPRKTEFWITSALPTGEFEMLTYCTGA